MAKHGENIYKRKDGRYEGRYVIGKTIQGKTRFGYVYGRQYIEVKNLLIQKKAAQQKTNNGNSRDTVSEWIFRWMENEIRGSVKISSYQTYNNLYKKHLLPAFEGLRRADVTPAVINDFISSLTAFGLAYSTMKSTYRLLSAAMRSAQDEGLIHKNPCKKIRIQRTETKEQRILTHNEQLLIRRKATQKEDTNEKSRSRAIRLQLKVFQKMLDSCFQDDGKMYKRC